jgi:predicted RNase H-like HicB family nuclease
LHAGIRFGQDNTGAWRVKVMTDLLHAVTGTKVPVLLRFLNPHYIFLLFRSPIEPWLIMKTLIDVHREGKFFVAVDLLSTIADQGLSEEEAMKNLRRGIEEHYELLLELTPRDHTLKYLKFEVKDYDRYPTATLS